MMFNDTEITRSQSEKVYADKLVEQFQNGEQAAFNDLMLRYQGRIYNVIHRHVRDPEDAYDLMQEVFLKAFTALGKFQRKSAFYSWLYRVAVNVCMDFLRWKARQNPSIAWDDVTPSEVACLSEHRTILPDEFAERNELHHKIQESVMQLPPQQQTAFVLRHRDGLQLKEIAVVMGRSEGTIKAHLFHANQRMRDMLTPYLNS